MTLTLPTTEAETRTEPPKAAEAMLQHVMSGFRSDDYLGAYFIPVSP